MIKSINQTSPNHTVPNGVTTVCMYCGKIRTPTRRWCLVDDDIINKGLVRCSHSACPECYRAALPHLVEEIIEEIRGED